MQSNSIVILLADDDPDDRILAAEALRQARMVNDLRFVEDGQELLDYLQRKGKFADPNESPKPGLILLDLNMPKIDGLSALRVIKEDENLRQIPVVVMTTSSNPEDIDAAYGDGVAGFVTKPVSFNELVDVMATVGKYWVNIVELPSVE